MNRRTFLSLAAVTALAGCTTSGDPNALRTQSNAQQIGGLIAEEVSTTPEDAMVIDATSGHLSTLEPVQTVVPRAARDGEAYALIRLDGETLETVEDALSDLPRYDGESGPPGYYLKYGGDTVVLYSFHISR
jgi:hypothetical protein